MAKNNGNFNINIKSFDGNPVYLESFFKQYKYLINAKKFTDDEAVLFLPNYLEGAASQYFFQNKEIQEAQSFEDVMQMFKNFFKSNVIFSLQDFDSLKMYENESIRNFILRLDNIAGKVFTDLTNEALENIKLKKFLTVIPNCLKIKLLEKENKSYKENINLAEKYQNIFQQNSISCNDLNCLQANTCNFQNLMHINANENNNNKTDLNVVNDKHKSNEVCQGDVQNIDFVELMKNVKTIGEKVNNLNEKAESNDNIDQRVRNYRDNDKSLPTKLSPTKKKFYEKQTFKTVKSCQICKRKGHTADQCFQFKNLQNKARQNYVNNHVKKFVPRHMQLQQYRRNTRSYNRNAEFTERNPQFQRSGNYRNRNTNYNGDRNSRLSANAETFVPTQNEHFMNFHKLIGETQPKTLINNEKLLNKEIPICNSIATQSSQSVQPVIQMTLPSVANQSSVKYDCFPQTSQCASFSSQNFCQPTKSVQQCSNIVPQCYHNVSLCQPVAQCYQSSQPVTQCYQSSQSVTQLQKSHNLADSITSSSQCCQNSKNIEFIANVSSNTTLPHIKVNIENFELNFLLDSGSTLSVLSHEFFLFAKNKIHYKPIARQCTISTLNSKILFKNCIELSFKLQNNFCKNVFYCVDMPEDSSFSGILGYDFFKKFSIVFSIRENCIFLKDSKIPIFDNVGKNKNTQSIQQLQNVQTTDKKEQMSQSFHVKLAKNYTILSNESAYVIVTITGNFPESHAYIQARESDMLKISNSIVDTKQNTIFLFIENSTSQTIHINKNQIVADAFIIDKIKENENNENHQINLIQATPEVIQLRKNEFKIHDFNILHLNKNQQQQIKEILQNNFIVFSKSLKALGHTDKVVPNLKFLAEYPIKTLPFPIPQALQEETLSQIQELVEAGIIERNISEWACPMLLVKKKTENKEKQKFRLALDLRLINAVMQSSTYPLPRIQDIISGISQGKFFTVLDLKSAYHQIDLPSEYKDRLTFVTPFGSFTNNRLPFGLKSAASIFQALIDQIIEEINMPNIYAYQDDIVISSDSFEETVDKLLKTFKVLSKYNITLAAEKCRFHETKIEYLGFEIQNKTITPIKNNIVKITSFPPPKTKKQVKRFLGMCGYYRNLIKDYAHLTSPLFTLSSPKTKFCWTEQHQEVFSQLQKLFFQKPLLKQPEWKKTFYLNTDASKEAISAILSQEHDGVMYPISYFSKSLSKSEKNYPPIKLELMAIVKGVVSFKHYLYGRKFVILSDSKPLAHYRKISSPTDIVTRWLLTLSEYSYVFQYIKGSDNVTADLFSRTDFNNSQDNMSNNPSIMNSKEILPIVEINEEVNNLQKNEKNNDSELEISIQTFLNEQNVDGEICQLRKDILNKKKKIEKFFIDDKTKLVMYEDKNDCVFPSSKIVVPKKLKEKVIKIAHLTHFGIDKTYEQLRKKYYWRGIFADAKNYVLSCHICNNNKHHQIPQAPFLNNFLPKRPGQYISMDFVGPFANGQHLLTVIDHFSKQLEIYIVRNITADAVINNLMKYISTHGRPDMILTDLGSQFNSEIFKKFNHVFKIKLNFTSSGHPQANGVSERINQSIKSTIACLKEEGYDFHTAVNIHKALYNASKHSSTGYSPNVVHFGRDLSILTDTYQCNSENIFLNQYSVLNDVLQTTNNIYNKVLHNLQVHQKCQNEKRQKQKLRNFKVGDIVYIKSKNPFKPTFSGPFEVLRLKSHVSCEICHPHQRNNRFVIHINRLHKSQRRFSHLQPPEVNPIPSSNSESNAMATHQRNLQASPAAPGDVAAATMNQRPRRSTIDPQHRSSAASHSSNIQVLPSTSLSGNHQSANASAHVPQHVNGTSNRYNLRKPEISIINYI